MPSKIGFTVVSSTGEDERYRAADLNYHGPTVKGWRSAQGCAYPQELTLQLHSYAVVHRIQILAHQYLIPQKIEIWTCEDIDYDPNTNQAFLYLGFITLSDNQTTCFKSRELKSVTTPPTPARYVRLRLHTNHTNDKNIYNQVGLVAVSVLGDEISQDIYGDDLNNNGQYDSLPSSDATLISNPQYTSPYDDLAFEMYVDKDVARIMRLMEAKKHQAVIEERFEYARKLKIALEELRDAGETLGRYEQEKRQAINLEDYDKAKTKKVQIEQYRDEVYSTLHVEQLLELEGPLEINDWSVGSPAVHCSNRNPPEPEPEIVEESFEPQSPPQRLEVDTRSPRHPRYMDSISPQVSEPYATWSPHRPRRRTSFSDYSSHRTVSPNQLSHSFSQTAFPTSVNSQPSRKVHSELPTPQFQCYTPYSYHPAISNQPYNTDPFHSLPAQEPFYLASEPATNAFIEPALEAVIKPSVDRVKSPTNSNTSNISRSPTNVAPRPNTLRGSLRRRKQNGVVSKSSYEAYEERMLPALRHPHIHGNDVIRECQIAIEQSKKSKLNERERKQAALPISVFGIDLVEKFYSKHFADKEEGLRVLQEQLKLFMKGPTEDNEETIPPPTFSANKMARAAIFLYHRTLRDKVYSVYSSAADGIRFFFTEFIPGRVSSAEVARSVEKLMPELIAKSGDVTPRIHNMAAHTLLSMADCKEVRSLHIIPVHLSRPISTSVHPRLALSRLEMVEQLILNQGISTEKQSGLTCRTLAEFGSSGLHHPAEAVRKVAERILVQVYKVNPRLVRKQLPPDDDVTRRNLLYRQLFQEFDHMDHQKRCEKKESEIHAATLPKVTKFGDKSLNGSLNDKPSEVVKSKSDYSVHTMISQIPKRTVNQQTSPLKPFMPNDFEVAEKDENQNRLKMVLLPKNSVDGNENSQKGASFLTEISENLSRRRNMSRISEEATEGDSSKEKEEKLVHFPNIVDSVLEARLPLVEKEASKMKSLKYIFPTSYIGTSTTSQEKVNKSNSITTFCKISPDFNIGKSHSSSNISGIPIPKNGFNNRTGGIFNSLLSAKKVGIKFSEKKDVPGKSLKEEVLTNTDMTTALYVPSTSSDSNCDQVLSETNADSSSSASIITPPSEGEPVLVKREMEGQTCKTCIFCFAKEDWFTEESLNIHYWKNCPMLTRCCDCKEVVEISGLIHHRLDDCEQKTHFTKCERCQEAVLKSDMETHECIVSTSISSKTRCTLCHKDLKNEDAWKEHLMGVDLCTNHPRKFQN